jgi:hypothetical protein
MKKMRLLPLLALGVMIFTQPESVESCGPFKEVTAFVNPENPDSITGFLQGKLQIVLPGFRRKYLFVAYRYLSGKPLSAAEAKALQTAWEPVVLRDEAQLIADERGVTPGLLQWLQERTQIPGTEHVAIDPHQSLDRFQWYVNCTESAFTTATLTLRQRSKQFGPQSAEVKRWLEGQDQVFFNCGGKTAIPSSLGSEVAPLVRADRQYQIGAAYFYAGDWDRARAQLLQVADDHSSPWLAMARYVAARALVRKATLQPQGQEKSYDPSTLAAAETELKKILANRELSSVHRYARQILDFVEIRLHPQERRAELDRELSQGVEHPSDLPQKLTDYFWVGFPAGEMSQWIAQMSNPNWASDKRWRQSVIESWQQHRDVPWLVAALSGAESSDAATPQLLEAAKSVPESSPAYLTVRYHELRLLAGHDQPAEVYAAASQLLRQSTIELTRSTRNALLDVTLRAAPDLDAFIANLPRRPSYSFFGEDQSPCQADDKPAPENLCGFWLLTDQGARLVNHLPLSTFAQVARSPKLPKSLQADLLGAVWTKAVLLGNDEVAASVAPDLMRAVPATRPLLATYLAADTQARRPAALFTLLRLPGLVPQVLAGERRNTPIDHIDDLRQNWWCSGGLPSDYWAESVESNELPRSNESAKPVEVMGFISPEQSQQAEKEAVQLHQLATAPNYLAEETLRWAREAPADQRLPEALHLVVRSTRYGCPNKITKEFSKQAFDLLHRRFPGSPWTKRTPYFYGGQGWR